VADAVRVWLRGLDRTSPVAGPGKLADSGLGCIGALCEDADLLDDIVECAMKIRGERPWRPPADE